MPRKGLAVFPERRPIPGASMRPGLLCPGKGRSGQVDRAPGDCFNEAGAVMPRKGPSALCEGGGLIGFNEAGAVMPRKGRASFASCARVAALQ